MFHRGLAAIACLVLAATPVMAQATAPAAAPAPAPAASAPTAAPAAAAPTTTKDGKPTMKVVREQCRNEVIAGGTKGPARRQAMADCIIKQRPDMTTRINCAMDPSLKGMDKDAKRDAVKACVRKSRM